MNEVNDEILTSEKDTFTTPLIFRIAIWVHGNKVNGVIIATDGLSALTFHPSGRSLCRQDVINGIGHILWLQN